MDIANRCVYIHKLKDNTVFYVGEGLEIRPYTIFNRSKKWMVITSENEYIVEIVKCNLTKEEALKLERELIIKYGRLNNNTGTLINCNDGGTSSKGKDNYFYGKSLHGEANGNFGNKYSKNPLSKAIYQLDLFGNIINEFESIQYAEDFYGFDGSCITGCCNGKRHLHQGYQFIYVKDYNINSPKIYKRARTHPQPVVSLILINNKLTVNGYFDSISSVKNYGFSVSSVEKKLGFYNRFHKNHVFIKEQNLNDEHKKQLELLLTNKI